LTRELGKPFQAEISIKENIPNNVGADLIKWIRKCSDFATIKMAVATSWKTHLWLTACKIFALLVSLVLGFKFEILVVSLHRDVYILFIFINSLLPQSHT